LDWKPMRKEPVATIIAWMVVDLSDSRLAARCYITRNSRFE
jgi:hypothetical protein